MTVQFVVYEALEAPASGALVTMLRILTYLSVWLIVGGLVAAVFCQWIRRGR